MAGTRAYGIRVGKKSPFGVRLTDILYIEPIARQTIRCDICLILAIFFKPYFLLTNFTSIRYTFWDVLRLRG